jgi:hypothetical protein
VRSICTLHELGECLREFVPNKEDFATLKLGPLQRLPVVYDMFKFPPDDADVPEITTLEVLEHLRMYMTVFNKWTTQLNMEEIMTYMAEQYQADDAYVLGVRIRSLPLAAQVGYSHPAITPHTPLFPPLTS